MSFRILETFNGYKSFYRDPFTGDMLEETKIKASMVMLMLQDQAKDGYVYTLQEAKN